MYQHDVESMVKGGFKVKVKGKTAAGEGDATAADSTEVWHTACCM